MVLASKKFSRQYCSNDYTPRFTRFCTLPSSVAADPAHKLVNILDQSSVTVRLRQFVLLGRTQMNMCLIKPTRVQRLPQHQHFHSRSLRVLADTSKQNLRC